MIDNVKSARVRRVASLARKKERFTQHRYLVEGPNAVRELLIHAPEQLSELYVTATSEPWQFDIDRLADAAQVEIIRVTNQVMSAMCDAVHPQGVLAVAEMSTLSLDEVLPKAKLVAILHEVRDPGNAGAVLRVADAAGADAVVFTGGSIDPWHPKVVRATTGSLFHLPVITLASLEDCVAKLHSTEFSVFAADVNGAELQPNDPKLIARTAWIFGNEAHGLTLEERNLASTSFRLPIFGHAESLNLASAASVLLYLSAFAQRSP